MHARLLVNSRPMPLRFGTGPGGIQRNQQTRHHARTRTPARGIICISNAHVSVPIQKSCSFNALITNGIVTLSNGLIRKYGAGL